MAARSTTSPSLGFLKIEWQIPGTKGHGLPDMFGEITCMRLVARTACPPLHCLIYMKKMKVCISVSEIGQLCRLFIQGDCLFMTAETEFVILNIKPLIKSFRVIVS